MLKHFFVDNIQFYNDILYFHQNYFNSVQYVTQSKFTDSTELMFKQAVFCFLTPATKSDSADYAYQRLFSDDFFYQATESEIAQCLREKPYIRFHNQKAKRLINWQKTGIEHINQIKKISLAQEKRQYIVDCVYGMSYKEATHFLRNIGQSEDLVILDRHIINFMKDVHILSQDQSMNQLSKNYIKWEQQFIQFISTDIWQNILGKTSIPQADFAIWAASVKKSSPQMSYERILQLS